MKSCFLVIVCCLLCCFNNSDAQPNPVNPPSIESLLSEYEATSITKIKLDKALQIILYYIDEDKDDSGQIWFDKISAIRNYNQITEQDYLFQSLQTELYYFSDLLNLAEQSNKEAIAIAKQLNNNYFLADAYFYKGLIHQSNGLGTEAMSNFIKASQFNPHSFNKKYEGYIAMPNHIYNNIAQEFNTLKQWDSSYKYNKMALEELRHRPAYRSKVLIYNDLANMFRNTNKTDSAIFYYQQSLSICNQQDIKDIPLLVYIGLANTMMSLNKTKEALQYVEMGNKQLTLNIGNYYSRVFYQEAIPLYKITGDLKGELKMYENLQQMHEKNNALYNKQLLTIYQHTTNNKNKLLISNLQTAQLKQRNANIQLLFMTLLLVSVGLSFFLYRKRQLVSNKLKVVRTDIGKDLHDEMGGAISSIKMFSGLIQHEHVSIEQVKACNEKISDLASELGQKLSTIIWSMDEKNDTVGNLVEKLQQYSVSFFEVSEINFQFSQTNGIGNSHQISGMKRKNIFLVCKEGLNNMMKHSGASQAWLYVSVIQDTLHIEMIDNGKGIQEKPKSGNGLTNMKNRIAEIEGTIEWVMQEGTVITLNCPI